MRGQVAVSLQGDTLGVRIHLGETRVLAKVHRAPSLYPAEPELLVNTFREPVCVSTLDKLIINFIIYTKFNLGNNNKKSFVMIDGALRRTEDKLLNSLWLLSRKQSVSGSCRQGSHFIKTSKRVKGKRNGSNCCRHCIGRAQLFCVFCDQADLARILHLWSPRALWPHPPLSPHPSDCSGWDLLGGASPDFQPPSPHREYHLCRPPVLKAACNFFF